MIYQSFSQTRCKPNSEGGLAAGNFSTFAKCSEARIGYVQVALQVLILVVCKVWLLDQNHPYGIKQNCRPTSKTGKYSREILSTHPSKSPPGKKMLIDSQGQSSTIDTVAQAKVNRVHAAPLDHVMMKVSQTYQRTLARSLFWSIVETWQNWK